MSLDLNESVESLIFALAQTAENLELYADPFVLEQNTDPSQADWEAAWLAAGNTLPIPEDQELYWKSGGSVRGQFARINDRFYCIFPSTSVSLAGVTHFAYTKFLGWEDDQHFFFSGTKIGDTGVVTGLFRAYLDGTCEAVPFTGFTANTLLGYDEAQRKLWYIQGTDLKRIDIDTEVITVISGGITVAPTQIAFDGAGDAFCTINVGAGLDVYRWNNTGATFTSVKASITVNGVAQDPGQVIAASLNYVVVLTSVSNYWVQFARSGGAETQIKSNPAGATAANLPAPSATAWTQILLGRNLDILSIGYAELTGTPEIGDWRRTILWNMATATYTNSESLPYDDFVATCIAESADADPINYTARRVTVFHTLTSAYRKRVSNAWEYHNISGARPNNAASRIILETDDGQIFVWANESSGKIWRISAWDQGESDMILFDVTAIGGNTSPVFIDLSGIPESHRLIEVIFQPAGSGAVAVNPADFWNLTGPGRTPALTGVVNAYGIDVDANSYQYLSNQGRIPIGSTQGALVIGSFYIHQGTSIYPHMVVTKSTTNTGVVNQTVTYAISLTFGSGLNEIFSLLLSGGTASLDGYLMVLAYRTEARRKGGAYYDPAMA